jgi:hypothetical protein
MPVTGIPKRPRAGFISSTSAGLCSYRPLKDGIEVMGVIDAVRDLPRHLRDA